MFEVGFGGLDEGGCEGICVVCEGEYVGGCLYVFVVVFVYLLDEVCFVCDCFEIFCVVVGVGDVVVVVDVGVGDVFGCGCCVVVDVFVDDDVVVDCCFCFDGDVVVGVFEVFVVFVECGEIGVVVDCDGDVVVCGEVFVDVEFGLFGYL